MSAKASAPQSKNLVPILALGGLVMAVLAFSFAKPDEAPPKEARVAPIAHRAPPIEARVAPMPPPVALLPADVAPSPAGAEEAPAEAEEAPGEAEEAPVGEAEEAPVGEAEEAPVGEAEKEAEAEGVDESTARDADAAERNGREANADEDETSAAVPQGEAPTAEDGDPRARAEAKLAEAKAAFDDGRYVDAKALAAESNSIKTSLSARRLLVVVACHRKQRSEAKAGLAKLPPATAQRVVDECRRLGVSLDER